MEIKIGDVITINETVLGIVENVNYLVDGNFKLRAWNNEFKKHYHIYLYIEDETSI
ncbi:MAG TPA: hypothetical protein VIO11_00460 [Candidatus Methanoperedens sp.]